MAIDFNNVNEPVEQEIQEQDLNNQDVNGVDNPQSQQKQPTPEEIAAYYQQQMMIREQQIAMAAAAQQQMMEQAAVNNWVQQQAQRQQMEAALLQERMGGLTPEQQQIVWTAYQQQLEADNMMQRQQLENYQLRKAAQAEAARRQQYEMAMAPFYREQQLNQLSQQFGVEKEILNQYGTTPEAAINVARAMADFKKRQNFQQRQQQGNDMVGTPTGQGGATSQNSTIKSKYANSGKLEDYIREMSRSRAW
jgi:hypothetical protein